MTIAFFAETPDDGSSLSLGGKEADRDKVFSNHGSRLRTQCPDLTQTIAHPLAIIMLAHMWFITSGAINCYRYPLPDLVYCLTVDRYMSSGLYLE